MKNTHIAVIVASLFTAAAYAAPVITCPAPVTGQCGSTKEMSVTVQDPAGSGLGVVWSVNGLAMQTNTVPGSIAVSGTNVSFAATFSGGTNVVDVTATDANTNTVSCS